MKLGEAYVEITGKLDGYEDALRAAENATTGFTATAKTSLDNVAAAGQAMSGVGLALTPLSAAITGIGTAAVAAFTELDSLTRGLTAVMGSSSGAEAELAKLKEVAKLPGLGFTEAIQGSINLQAAGFSAETARAALSGFGNALATVGKGKAELDGVVTALSQIASKGKVSAEEIGQLAERVPQIRQIMIAAFGTADTEWFQKQGIGAQQFVEKVTAELAKLPPVTGGMKNDFENLKDQITITLGQIGEALSPIVAKVVQFLADKIVPAIQAAVDWFKGLPAPVQGAIGALAGLAAVVGPLLLVLGQLVGAFTMLSPVIGPVVAAIGGFTGITEIVAIVVALTAALGALGVWISEHGPQIQAVLGEAFTIVKERWETFFGWVVPAVEGAFNAVVAALQQAGGFLIGAVQDPLGTIESIWDKHVEAVQLAVGLLPGGLRTIAQAVIGVVNGLAESVGSIIGGIVKFVAEKVGGIASAISNFTGLGPGIQRLQEAWSKAGEEMAKAAKNAGDKIADPLTKNQRRNEEQTKKHKEKLDDLGKTLKDLDEKYLDGAEKKLGVFRTALQRVEAQYDNGLISIGQYRNAKADLEKKIADAEKATGTYSLSVTALDKIMNTYKVKMDEVSKAYAKLKDDTGLADQTAKTFDGTVTALTNKIGAQASTFTGMNPILKATDDALKAIQSSSGSVFDESARLIESWKSLKDNGAIPLGTELTNIKLKVEQISGTFQKAGLDIPPELKKIGAEVDALGAGDTGKLGKLKKDGDSVFQGIKAAADSFGRDLNQSIVNGDLKGMLNAFDGLWKGIASSVLDSFIKPATEAISSFISDILLGENGILGGLRGIGSAIMNMFSGGGGAGAAVSGVGGSIASSINSALSGVMSILNPVNMVANIAGAISGIIGNFQMSGMAKDLGEMNRTLIKAEMYLGSRADGGIVTATLKTVEQLTYVNASLDDMKKWAWGDGPIAKLVSIAESLSFIKDQTVYFNPSFDTMKQQGADLLAEIKAYRVDFNTFAAASGGAAKAEIHISGNYLLDDSQSERLADRIFEVLQRRGVLK